MPSIVHGGFSLMCPQKSLGRPITCEMRLSRRIFAGMELGISLSRPSSHRHLDLVSAWALGKNAIALSDLLELERKRGSREEVGETEERVELRTAWERMLVLESCALWLVARCHEWRPLQGRPSVGSNVQGIGAPD